MKEYITGALLLFGVILTSAGIKHHSIGKFNYIYVLGMIFILIYHEIIWNRVKK
jgi:hypothetical protein